jgi:hypothetical protein
MKKKAMREIGPTPMLEKPRLCPVMFYQATAAQRLSLDDFTKAAHAGFSVRTTFSLKNLLLPAISPLSLPEEIFRLA